MVVYGLRPLFSSVAQGAGRTSLIASIGLINRSVNNQFNG